MDRENLGLSLPPLGSTCSFTAWSFLRRGRNASRRTVSTPVASEIRFKRIKGLQGFHLLPQEPDNIILRVEQQPTPSNQPVKRGENRGNVFPLSCTRQQVSCCILDPLQSGERGLTNANIEAITIVQTRWNKNMEKSLEVYIRQERFDLGELSQLEKTWLNYLVNLFIHLKIPVQNNT